MKYKSNRIRVGTMMHPDVVKICDENIVNTSSESRNDFIEEAILFYVGYLNSKQDVNYLSKSIETVIKSSIHLTEDRICKILFKFCIELSMLMNIIAASNNIDDNTLNMLRKKCLDEVKSSTGKLNIEDIFRYQRNG